LIVFIDQHIQGAAFGQTPEALRIFRVFFQEQQISSAFFENGGIGEVALIFVQTLLMDFDDVGGLIELVGNQHLQIGATVHRVFVPVEIVRVPDLSQHDGISFLRQFREADGRGGEVVFCLERQGKKDEKNEGVNPGFHGLSFYQYGPGVKFGVKGTRRGVLLVVHVAPAI